MNLTPTPVPTNFETDVRFMLPSRSIVVLCRPEDRGKLGDGTIRTVFVNTMMELIGRVTADRAPLVLMHAAAVTDADLEMAAILRDLPCAAVTAVLADEEQGPAGLQLAKRMGLGWVFPDSALRFPRELHRWADWIERGGPAPGIAPHLEVGGEVIVRRVASRADKSRVIETALEFVKARRTDTMFLFDLRLMLEEAINNSIYHGFLNAAGGEKYSVENFKELAENESVEVEFGADSRTLAFAVGDNQGNLRRDHIIHKIERHLSAKGVFDQNGRGLYLIHSLAGRALFNLYPKKMTQIVMLQPAHSTAWVESTLKPLLIFSH